jgi:hypothetical protein
LTPDFNGPWGEMKVFLFEPDKSLVFFQCNGLRQEVYLLNRVTLLQDAQQFTNRHG